MDRSVSGAAKSAGTEQQARERSPARGLFHDPNGSAGLERIRTIVVEDHEEIALLVADRIATLIKDRNATGAHAVLGLATGSTPIGVYRELVRLHKEEGLSFRHVVTFNLDEYYPMPP